MDSVRFLITGNCFLNKNYYRSSDEYPVDQISAKKAVHVFSGSITQQIENEKTCTYMIDGAVVFNSVLPKHREAGQSFWKSRKLEVLLVAGLFATAGVALATLCVTGVLTPMVGGSLVVGSVALSCFSLYRYFQARKAHMEWENPLERYCSERQKIGSQGFNYIYGHQLKNRLAHPDEVLCAYKKNAKTHMKTAQSTSLSSQQIKAFFANNPLEEKCFKYAYEGSSECIPESFERLNQYYKDLHVEYRDVRQGAEIERSKIRRNQAAQNKKNDEKREQGLAPFQKIKELYDQQAQSKRDALLLPYVNKRNQQIENINQDLSKTDKEEQKRKAWTEYRNNPHVQQFNRECEDELRKHQFLYDLAAAPILGAHEEKKTRINKWADEKMKGVNEKENQNLSSFAPRVKDLADAYLDPSIPQERSSFFVEENLYPDIQDANDGQWSIPAYNPEWLRTQNVSQDLFQEFYQHSSNSI